MWTFSVTDEYLSEFLPADGYDGVLRPHKTLGGEFHRFQRWLSKYCLANGHEAPVYAWSIESISSGEREYHPHLCCLISLVLRRDEFYSFIPLAEAAYGLGGIHMTVLNHPRGAATYLLKAVKYTVKGQDGNQGRVWGQRWAVSSAIRPVEVREASEDRSACWELEEVASLMRECGRGSIKTDFGSVTVRGFYPARGFGADDVWLACAAARSELAPMLEAVTDPF
jgi:hypothetical protein